jgi:hypothetical protein
MGGGIGHDECGLRSMGEFRRITINFTPRNIFNHLFVTHPVGSVQPHYNHFDVSFLGGCDIFILRIAFRKVLEA